MIENDAFEPYPNPVGYNSHGYWSTFRDIVEIEADRGNYPFDTLSESLIEQYGECPAIWVTSMPYDAFMYVIPAGEVEDGPVLLAERYPGWESDVETIDCTGCYRLKESDDGDDGYLIIQPGK